MLSLTTGEPREERRGEFLGCFWGDCVDWWAHQCKRSEKLSMSQSPCLMFGPNDYRICSSLKRTRWRGRLADGALEGWKVAV